MPEGYKGHEERTEEPSSRRREEARAGGDVAVSPELATLFVVLGGALVLYYAALPAASGISAFMQTTFTNLEREISVETAPGLFRLTASTFFIIILPALVIPLVGALAYLLQTGMVFSGRSVEPGLGEINPAAGVKRLFSAGAYVELLRFVVKVSAVGYVAYRAVAAEAAGLPLLMDSDVATSVAYIAGATFRVMTGTLWVFVVIGVVDYAYARLAHERGLRMTREEAAEEARSDEAAPAVRARIRTMHKDASAKERQ